MFQDGIQAVVGRRGGDMRFGTHTNTLFILVNKNTLLLGVGEGFSLNGSLSTNPLKKTFSLHLHFIFLSRGSITALSGSISCSLFLNRASINKVAVSLSSRPVSLGPRLLCPSLCH